MIGNSYRKSRVRASMSPNSNYGNIEEMSEDLRNDLKIAFNLFKNNEGNYYFEKKKNFLN